MTSQSDEACANPLLLDWRAYEALKACPISFTHPSEAKQLHGFGDGLCTRLTKKLEEYCEAEGLPIPEKPTGKRKNVLPQNDDKDNDDKDDDEPPPAKKVKKTKPYVPTLRTGPYGIILALATLNEDSQGLTKGQVIELAQPHCDSSYTIPSDATSYYTAWKSMQTLVGKDVVKEAGRPSKRYTLTDEGWEVAQRIKATIKPSQTQLNNFTNSKDAGKEKHPAASDHVEDERSTSQAVGLIPHGDLVSDEASLPTFSPLTIPAGSFTVEFMLDVREIRATRDRDYLENELIKRGIKPIMKALALGDGLWVAKCKDPQLLQQLGLEGDYIMLDWIVERKRLDDLVGSIKDGRFHEQKFRLKKSGVKNVIYIIEEMKVQDEFQKYAEAVQSAIASTQVVNEYFVKKTQKMDDTIRYLARMTVLLRSLYENRSIYVIPTRLLTARNHLPLLKHLSTTHPDRNFQITYSALDSLASKSDTMTLRDYYLKMLMCTRGLTGEKALEIQKVWKTPAELARAFRACGDDDKRKRELITSKMGDLVGRKKIGNALSGKIAENWGSIRFV
ncbi:crossover junction endonuclease MUS81 [Phlyctema vagabunda]|uniref:Crossover junction endonuclease MUS81 n=1 Tax=Phlyctema vagabunda TaxID=108571 RepID=A0ABR4PXH9_9HELO